MKPANYFVQSHDHFTPDDEQCRRKPDAVNDDWACHCFFQVQNFPLRLVKMKSNMYLLNGKLTR